MKKIYVACFALLLSMMLTLAGCMPSKSEVLDYLKSNAEFEENFAERDKYTVEFSVDNDLAYSLKISDTKRKELKDYSAAGTLNYLGSYTKSDSYESWGITTSYKIYYYVIKLDGATARLDIVGKEQECNFYLIMHTFSDNIDFSDPHIVWHVADGSEEASLENVGVEGYRITCKNK